ncbi:unnamed protein product [Calypogeia fissa]
MSPLITGQTQERAAQQHVAAGPSHFMSSALYVGELEPNVSEPQLYDIFRQIGHVVSVRVCRHKITRGSLGYGHVNYNTTSDAARALELLNFTLVNGKPIRIMFANGDTDGRKSGTANIFIKNLESSIDSKALLETFSNFGSILSCKVVTDDSGNSKGYGFVQFEDEGSAQSAIESANGMLFNNKKVFVGPFVRRQEGAVRAVASEFNNVFVKNIAESTTDEELRDHFAVFGNISSAVVMRHSEGKSKCFGFANFPSSEDAVKAVDALNGKNIGGKEWFVGKAQKKSEREAELRGKVEKERKEGIQELYHGVNLFIKNLDDSIDDVKLGKLFAEFGTIKSCKVVRSPEGHSKGSGFVAFSTPEEANRAVASMNRRIIGSKPLFVAPAQSKDERIAWRQTQISQTSAAPAAGLAVPSSMPMFHHPRSPAGVGNQIFYGQSPPSPILLQPAEFLYQQQMHAGVRHGARQNPQYFYAPVVSGIISQQGGALGRARAPWQQQQQHMQSHRGNGRYSYNRNVPRNALRTNQDGLARNINPDASVSPQEVLTAETGVSERKEMLGELLYPMVDVLEHDHAGKVTGMLLEMDLTEILNLFESPEALIHKVAEAMEVLQMAQAAKSAATEELADLSLDDAAA